ncbi:MAG: lytic transglycosylase domain-containing protein [Bacteroidota bacterium]
MKNAARIISFTVLVLIAFIFINADTNPDKDPKKKNTAETYDIKALKIPRNLNFAGERIPLKQHDIKERIDRELLVNTYWQSNGLLYFKRANKYFPVIEPILKKHNIPDDFKYLALIESGLQNVTSPAGAKGFWQLMPKTAREYGLEVNENVDERYHLEKSTVAACLYLREAYEKFGNWTMAAAAYNAGKSGISRQVERQKVNSYYDLLLNAETARYIPRIVSVKEILNNPYKYGFKFEKEDLYTLVPTHTIKVDTAVSNLADFAKGQGINYKELKIHNPWLRENKLNNKSRRLYKIKIPD